MKDEGGDVLVSVPFLVIDIPQGVANKVYEGGGGPAIFLSYAEGILGRVSELKIGGAGDAEIQLERLTVALV